MEMEIAKVRDMMARYVIAGQRRRREDSDVRPIEYMAVCRYVFTARSEIGEQRYSATAIVVAIGSDNLNP